MPTRLSETRYAGAKIPCRVEQLPFIDHRTHAMVSLLNLPEDQAEKMRAVLRLVQVVSAMARCASGSAIFWSASGTLLPVGQFRDLTTRWTASPDEVPLLLICRVLAYRDGEDGAGQPRHGVFSVGLKSFIGREVELTPQSVPFDNAVQSFDKVANHLLRAGGAFRGGDAFIVSSIGQVNTRLGSDRSGKSGSLILCDIDKGERGQPTETFIH